MATAIKLISISQNQVHNGSVEQDSDGNLKVLTPLYGIVATELGDRQAKQAAKASGSVADLLAAKTQHQLIGVPAGTTLQPREPVVFNGVTYNAVHAGSVFLNAAADALTVFDSREAQKAAMGA